MLSVAIGNLFTSAVNFFIQNHEAGRVLAGADYFGFFTGLMLVTALLFLFVVRFYREKTYIQDEAWMGLVLDQSVWEVQIIERMCLVDGLQWTKILNMNAFTAQSQFKQPAVNS